MLYIYTAYGTDIGIVSMSLLHIVYVINYTYLIHIQFLLQYDISLFLSLHYGTQNKKGIGMNFALVFHSCTNKSSVD